MNHQSRPKVQAKNDEIRKQLVFGGNMSIIWKNVPNNENEHYLEKQFLIHSEYWVIKIKVNNYKHYDLRTLKEMLLNDIFIKMCFKCFSYECVITKKANPSISFFLLSFFLYLLRWCHWLDGRNLSDKIGNKKNQTWVQNITD